MPTRRALLLAPAFLPVWGQSTVVAALDALVAPAAPPLSRRAQAMHAASVRRIRAWIALHDEKAIVKETQWLTAHLPPAFAAPLQALAAAARNHAWPGQLRDIEVLATLPREITGDYSLNGGVVLFDDVVAGYLDPAGRAVIPREPGNVQVSVYLADGNVGAVASLTATQTRIRLPLDEGKEFYWHADAMLHEQTIAIALRSPWTNTPVPVVAVDELYLDDAQGRVLADLTELFRARRGQIVAADPVRLRRELTRFSGPFTLSAHVQDTTGRSWRLAVPFD